MNHLYILFLQKSLCCLPCCFYLFLVVSINSNGFAAIATVVSIAEILKNNGLAVEKSELFGASTWCSYLSSFDTKICFMVLWLRDSEDYLFLIKTIAEIVTSTVEIKDDSKGRPVQKAKVIVVILSVFVKLFLAFKMTHRHILAPFFVFPWSNKKLARINSLCYQQIQKPIVN